MTRMLQKCELYDGFDELKKLDGIRKMRYSGATKVVEGLSPRKCRKGCRYGMGM